MQGVKFDSCFNELAYFHVCRPGSGLPPCLGHDLFEGIVSFDVASILKHFIKQEKWFTYTHLNRKIAQFKYLGSDKNNKPNQINPKGDGLGGQALQNWCLVRLLPLIIGDKIREPENEYWQQFLRLRDIIEVVCAPQISEAQVAILNFTIDEYLEARSNLFPDYRFKPKHHFLKHYPLLILQYGPLIRTWTMRFESKHSYFKNCVRHLQNFKSICKTLAERRQLLQAYRCAGEYFAVNIKVKQAIPLHVDTYTDGVRDCILRIGGSPADQITYELIFRGTTYKTGNYLVIGFDGSSLKFGEIVFVLVRTNSEAYFVMQVHKSVFNTDLHVHSIDFREEKSYTCIKSENILDYYPLSAYGNKQHCQIPLKHAIPSAYFSVQI